MGRLFGTDGVRGVANSQELSPSMAYALGRAGSYVLSKENDRQSTILVGKDTRISGDMLEAALIAGICSTGAKAVRLGVVPTPAVAYLAREMKADAGVVISASHNPFEFNGIKFFNGQGYKLSDEIEDEIQRAIENGLDNLPSPIGENVGSVEDMADASKAYVDFVIDKAGEALSGMRIALDCAEGASYRIAPTAFTRLGAEVLAIHTSPNGRNINDHCGSTHTEDLQQFVVANHCDLGLAFDGDADRLLAVDETGRLIDGDEIMAIMALDAKERGRLKENTLVATIMSNMGLSIFGENHGIKVNKTKVGDRYVLEEMLAGGYVLGGEQSGHIILLDYNTTGDGLLSAMMLSGIVRRSGKTLSQLAKAITILPQALVNAKLGDKTKKTLWETDEEIQALLKKTEEKLSGSGRVLIRPSGTEPLIRVMIEGEDQQAIEADCHAIAELIERKTK